MPFSMSAPSLRAGCALLALAGCTGATPVDAADTGAPVHRLAPGFEASLDQVMGCSDSSIYAWNEDTGTGLVFSRTGLVADTAAGPVDRTLVVGVDAFTLAVEMADPIAGNWCTDDHGNRELFVRYEAVSGTAVVHMDPPATSYGPAATDLELTSVVFDDGDGNTVTVPTFRVDDVSVIQDWGG